MTVTASLRALGLLAVTGALLDPGCARQRRPIVEVAFAGDAPETARVRERARIADAAPWATVVDALAPARGSEVLPVAARVVAGEPAYVLDALQRRGADLAWEWTPPSLVLATVRAPTRVVVGMRTAIVVTVGGVPAGEGQVRVAVTDAASGLEQARAEATRKAVDPSGTVIVSVPWLATREGPARLRVLASLEDGAAVQPSPPGDVIVIVHPARVDVSVLEARPTWAGRFARLALADQAGIDVRTEVRVAPGIAVRTASGPTAASNDESDVILVSGVEALTSSDVSRLETGVRERGQAVVLLMDEAPGAGAWRRLWPDVLGTLRTMPTPVIGRVGGHVWKMREWLAAPLSTAVTPLASLESEPSAFVLGRAMGAGRVVLVSALDAWRWRGDVDVAFAAGWRALVRRLGADVPPAVAATAWVSGHGRSRLVQVDVALRPDLADGDDLVVDAALGNAGVPVILRQVEAGRWRGTFRAPAASTEALVVQARAGRREIGQARAVIDVRPAALVASWGDVVGHQASRGRLSTGGAPLPGLMAKMRDAVPRPVPDRWYVTRTWWFAGAVLAALGAEWILRRLSGGAMRTRTNDMAQNRREFLKVAGAAGAAWSLPDLWTGPVSAQAPRARTGAWRTWGTDALRQARGLGCSYADVRFGRKRSQALNVRNGLLTSAGGFSFGGFGATPGGGISDTFGFGVRVVHSGVWGFASSPIVTADEVRRVVQQATNIAKASAMAKRFDVTLAPVPAYDEFYETPHDRDPFVVPLEEKLAILTDATTEIQKNRQVLFATAQVSFSHDWKFLVTSEGSFIEQSLYYCSCGTSATARTKGQVKTRIYTPGASTAGYEFLVQADLKGHAERVAAEAVEHSLATPVQAGLKDLVLKPSHLALTIHEIIAHPTELDRIVGYEANYAGTSFVKLADLGKLKYGSPLLNVYADRTHVGACGTVGFDDDGVKSQRWPIIREGRLVGLQTNRETAHYMGETESRGCTFANHWRNYPFLRMPNIQMEAGKAGSPSLEQMIADVKDGVLVDGSGSFSIDQQRYNGQFGGNAFWEIKNGKVTRMVTDFTYNAITTDFWVNLDAVGPPESWEHHGMDGDAKGQPVQSNYPSHGSAPCLIRKVMVGAAFA